MQNRALMQKKRETFLKSRDMRNMVAEFSSYDQAREFQKKQQEEYDKFKFFDNLYKAMEKQTEKNG